MRKNNNKVKYYNESEELSQPGHVNCWQQISNNFKLINDSVISIRESLEVENL